jgi:hypothetical protein
VAGFISSENDWADFDKAWQARLSADGLSYFHMAEFAQSTGQFHGWKNQEVKRHKLLYDLMMVIKSHVYRKFGCAIVNEILLTHLSEDLKQEYYLKAYALVGRTYAAKVREWAKMEKFPSPIELVFEDGDSGKGELFNRLRKDGFPDPVFKPKAFTPLQAADFLAYEAFLVMKRLDDENYHCRWAIPEFHKVPGEIGDYTVSDMKDLENMLRVQRSSS